MLLRTSLGRGWRREPLPFSPLEKDGAVQRVALRLALLMTLLAPGCRGREHGADGTDRASPCANGSSSCAAAQAPPGLRQVRKGHRMIRTHWLDKTNKESGAPDIGIQADWAPIRETR